jgi:hypothetical protein
MFTICPDSTGSFKIFQKAKGYDEVFGFDFNTPTFDIDAIQAYIDAGVIPNRRHRTDTAASHAYDCALVYNEIILSIIQYVIGWNMQTKSASPEGGLFGHPLAFVGSTESQSSGNLHCHFLIWISGLPTNSSELSTNTTYSDYKASISSLNFPTPLNTNCDTVHFY